MIVSSGGFTDYRAEGAVFSELRLRFGDLSRRINREKLMAFWLRTNWFAASGLDALKIRDKILTDCRSAGDFQRMVMEEIARKQGVKRWIETTNDHTAYIPEIKSEIPNALFIHVIRDGRDVALSMEKTHQIEKRNYPWSEERRLIVSGQYWEWLVKKGRADGLALGQDYVEVHYEDLVLRPRETLAGLSPFVEHDLDYDYILEHATGRVNQPNTAFGDDRSGPFNPIGRWKTKMSAQELVDFESVVGDTLRNLGYPLATPEPELNRSWEIRKIRALTPRVFGLKHWLRSHTPAVRLRPIPEGFFDPRITASGL
jgi:hypothetical protein